MSVMDRISQKVSADLKKHFDERMKESEKKSREMILAKINEFEGIMRETAAEIVKEELQKIKETQ